MRKGLTGNKNTDIIALNKLSDEDLRAVCQINSYTRNICNDDLFWASRLQSRYPRILSPGRYTWRDLYFYIQIQQKYGTYLGSIDDIAADKPASVSAEQYLSWLDRFFKLMEIAANNSSVYVFLENLPHPLFELINRAYQDINGAQWGPNKIESLREVHRFYEVSSHKLRTFSPNEDPDYLFLETIRLAGYPDEIRNFLTSFGYGPNDMNIHINHAQRNPMIQEARNKFPNTLFDLKPLEEEVDKILETERKFDEITTYITDKIRHMDADHQRNLLQDLSRWARNY